MGSVCQNLRPQMEHQGLHRNNHQTYHRWFHQFFCIFIQHSGPDQSPASFTSALSEPSGKAHEPEYRGHTLSHCRQPAFQLYLRYALITSFIFAFSSSVKVRTAYMLLPVPGWTMIPDWKLTSLLLFRGALH